jgi:hypothetical protein
MWGSQRANDCNIRQVCERNFWVVKKYQAGLQNTFHFPERSFGQNLYDIMKFLPLKSKLKP